MSYYQGDFYQGDFYQGDPFWGGLFTLAKRGIGMLSGMGRAAPVTAIQKIGGRIPGMGAVMGAVRRHPILSAAGAAGTIGALGGRRTAGMMGAPGMKGFHLSKKTGAMVRNRRMRVTNPRALRRAIRRATGFAKLARRVLHFTSPRVPRGRAIFKVRRGGARRLKA